MSQIAFKSLKMQNFWSFGNKPIEIQLDTSLTTLIMGHNKDVGAEGYSRNGAGKSAMLQALFWCLFGEGIGNIKQDDFINLKNKKRMSVELELTIDGSLYKIIRGRKPNRVEMTKDNQPFTLSTAKNVDEAIITLLGMDSSIFLNTVLLTTNTESFMAQKPAQQRDFMERLLSMNLLSERATSVKVIRSDTVAELKGEEKALEQIERSNSRVVSNINELENKSKKWDLERASGTNDLEADLQDLQQVDPQAELAAIEQLEGWEKELGQVVSSIEKTSRDADKLFSDIDKLNVELESLIQGKCPYCTQAFTNELKIEQVRDQIDSLNTRAEEMSNAIDPVLAREEELKSLIEEWKLANPDAFTRAEVQELMAQIRVLEGRIQDLRKEATNPYLEQIELLRGSIEAINKDTLYELQTIQTHCDVLVKLLTDSKSFIRRNIIDQYIPFLNKRINGYLDALQLAHGVMINNDLTVDVEYLGDSISYGNLSNGEKLRVDLAVNLAFRDLVEVSGSNTNLLILDEFLDNGSDLSFFYSTMKLLGEKKGLSTFLVSHREEIKTMVDRIMMVTKENGFSSIDIQGAA